MVTMCPPRIPVRLIPRLVLFWFFMSACGGAARSTPAAAGDPHTFNPCAGDTSGGTVSCESWASWPQINDATFRSKGHQKAWVDVHVEPQFEAAYRAGTGPMPAGMRIVKAAHADGDTPGAVTGLTVMVKMEPGYDPDHGDWFYGVYDASGTVASKQGKLTMCIGCHSQWADNDYLGGVPGLWDR